jgi:hypothetical protein
MRLLMKLIGVLALVAAFMLSDTAASDSEDWGVYMTVTTNPQIGTIPGEGFQFGFGARDGASDGYNLDEGDRIAPPDPLEGINAYFYYPGNPSLQKNLIMSVTAPAASIMWALVVKMVGTTGDAEITISWPDITSVPSRYAVLELRATGGNTLADMRSVDHYTFSAAEGHTYNFNIVAISEETPNYRLSVGSTQGGSVSKPGEGAFVYPAGTVVTLVATADSGYRFANWTGDVSTLANVNAASTTITINADYFITANFAKVETTSPPPKHDLTVQSTEGGRVTTPGQGPFTYDEGTAVELAAQAEPGYRFVNWTGDVDTVADVNAASTSVTMNGDYSVTANFVRQYGLTASSTTGGSVTSPGQGTFAYDEGTVVTLVATADEGYRFVNWTGDVPTVADVNSASTTVTMNGDYSITANFKRLVLVNWALIGGIIAAVAVAGLLVFFLLKRRTA